MKTNKTKLIKTNIVKVLTIYKKVKIIWINKLTTNLNIINQKFLIQKMFMLNQIKAKLKMV